MAQVTLTVDDSIIPRLQAAYGVGSNAQLKTAIIKQIKDTVQNYETGQVQDSETAKVKAAQASRDTAIATAISKAQTEIVVT